MPADDAVLPIARGGCTRAPTVTAHRALIRRLAAVAAAGAGR